LPFIFGFFFERSGKNRSVVIVVRRLAVSTTPQFTVPQTKSLTFEVLFQKNSCSLENCVE